MKTIVLFATLVFYNSVKCQIPYFKELLGYTDKQACAYLDSLNSLKPTANYKISRDVNQTGNLTLNVFYPDENQDLITCRQIFLIFKRVEGSEVCISQSILGDSKYAYRNIAHIKDTYKELSENRWELVISNDGEMVFKKVAEFKRFNEVSTSEPYYTIDYFFEEHMKKKNRKH